MASEDSRLLMARAPYTFMEKLAGFVLVAIFLLVMGAVAIVGAGRGLFRGYTEYFAVYSQGYGITPGVDVRFFGIEIGSVTDVDLQDNNKIKMSLKIADNYTNRVLGDSLALIKTSNIIGAKFIEIQPGTDGSRPIPGGGQIPAQDTATLEEMAATLDSEIPKKLAQADALLKHFTSIADRLQDTQGPLFATLENFRTVSARMASGEGSLGALLTRNEAHDELYAAIREIRQASVSVKEAAASIRATAAGLERDMPGITSKADLILNEIEQGTRSFPEVARGAREGVRDVHQVLDSAKRNFLIRGNLTGDPPPEDVDLPLRGR